jgi:L-aminopeptidase/D-esterase-like protein
MQRLQIAAVLCLSLASASAWCAAPPTEVMPRARSLGIPFEGTPGRLDAITDVPGVEVGQLTLVRGEGRRAVGAGPVRTGVTVVLPLGRGSDAPVQAGFFDLNGNGEMTAQSYLQDFGVAYGPIGLTNTNAIGDVYAGIMHWTSQRFGSAIWPVVSETWDGDLNDIEGFHVKPEHAIAAIEAASGGAVAEGNVGGGTGMVCFGFKGGIGTASRQVRIRGREQVVGVLVQCNTGRREVLRIAGAPVGSELAESWLPCFEPAAAAPDKAPLCRPDGAGGLHKPDQGSIVIVVGTDVPLSAPQLNRVARRAALGLGRLGSYSGNSSGDLVLSFTTAPGANDPDHAEPVLAQQIANADIDLVFEATVQATEEAIVNALVAARTMSGADGYTVFALPHEALRAVLAKYHRLAP